MTLARRRDAAITSLSLGTVEIAGERFAFISESVRRTAIAAVFLPKSDRKAIAERGRS